MNASTPAMLLQHSGEQPAAQDLARALEAQRPALSSFLRRRLRNEADVEDALQETALRVLRYDTGHDIESLSALLFRIAEHVAVDVSRRAQARQAGAHCPLEDLELPSGDASPDQLVEAGQDLGLLVDALERLSPKCQNVFLLSRMEGLTYQEIAVRCGISVKMVEKYMHRALGELRAGVGGWSGAAP